KGQEPFSIQWKKDGHVLLNETNALLVVQNTQTNSEGAYTVLVTNLFGAVSSRTADLVLAAPPAITDISPHQAALPGLTLTLSVAATGFQPLSFQWRKAGVSLNGKTNANLRLPSIEAADAGAYQVTISNRFGL